MYDSLSYDMDANEETKRTDAPRRNFYGIASCAYKSETMK